MKKVVELKQERASLKDKQQALVNKAKGEKRDMSEAENTSFDTYQNQREALDVQIKRALIIEADEARASQGGENIAEGDGIDAPKVERFSLLRGLRNLANGKALTGAELDLHERTQEDMRSQGLETKEGLVFSLPLQSRAQTVTADSGGKGGALVASTPKLVKPLQPTLGIEDMGVNVMSGLVGDVPLPTNAAFSFSYVAENGSVSATDVAIAGPTLKPKRCAGVVDISKKLLAQTSFDVEAWIIEQINIAYGNAVLLAAINGPGTNAPTGLLSLITTNVDTTAGLGTYDTIVNLEGLIDDANATSVHRGYLSDTKLRSILKTTKIDSGSGVFLTDGKEMNGYKYTQSTLMPILDTDKHPLIFGDWSQLTVGYWSNISILVDPYTQAASGNVRLVIEGFSDVAVTNEKAFAVNKVMTLVAPE